LDKSDFISFIHSGGGITRIIEKGNLIEKGGVNTSIVHGPVTAALAPGQNNGSNYWFGFTKRNAEAFIEAYVPILKTRRNEVYRDQHRYWQEIRRGGYVEFNLLHDRGTLFGLRSGGRTESILMSLPPRVRFEYDHHPEPGSEEATLLEILKTSP